jgi:DNA-damage-inducible protein J
LREGWIPFRITTGIPNHETVAAMLEAEKIASDPAEKGYTDVDELLAELNS